MPLAGEGAPVPKS